jgi:hypothetical protein
MEDEDEDEAREEAILEAVRKRHPGWDGDLESAIVSQMFHTIVNDAAGMVARAETTGTTMDVPVAVFLTNDFKAAGTPLEEVKSQAELCLVSLVSMFGGEVDEEMEARAMRLADLASARTVDQVVERVRAAVIRLEYVALGLQSPSPSDS